MTPEGALTARPAAGVDASADGRWDAIVVGAGFGGLGAGLALAERGARVLVCEALGYPGGCASTFQRDGFRFEAGATLFSGFAEGQLFRRWIDRHRLAVELEWLDPLVELRAPDLALAARRDRAALPAQLAALPGAPRERLDAFFAYQRRVADALWGVLDDPHLLPPFDARALLRHARALPRYLPLARCVGRPLRRVLERFGLADWRPLTTWLDALCQITVQCGAAEAEAPFALGAMDYLHRGTAHVVGGIGVLAEGLVGAVRVAGGKVVLANRVRHLAREGDLWRVETRRGTHRAPHVVANVLPQGLRELLDVAPGAHGTLDELAAGVEEGWGACMLYLAARPPAAAPETACHLEIVQDPTRPFVEGNHLFVSASSPRDPRRAPAGLRTLTVSTHVPLRELRALDAGRQAEYVAAVQQRMRQGLERHAPEWHAGVVYELTASPRTFERFTRRFLGHVGGVPRRAGLHHYRRLAPRAVQPGLWLVGDSVFPGQSTLAAALGGVKVAERVATQARG